MLFVAGAEFFMGRTPEANPEGSMLPGHLQRIESFFIDQYEVTVLDYIRCMHAGQCAAPRMRDKRCNLAQTKQRSDHPMNCLNFYEAGTFCGVRGGRLPSAAEWQLAARGTDRRTYPWGNAEPSDQLCWQGRPGESLTTTCPVGHFPSGVSPCGAFDMAGNVAEWTDTTGEDTMRQTNFIAGGSFKVGDEDGFPDDPLYRDIRLDMPSFQRRDRASVDVGFRCMREVSARP
jgi:formylglycine-generating enzyme required for sulfatase activity